MSEDHDQQKRHTRAQVALDLALQKEQQTFLRIASPQPLPKGTKCKYTQTGKELVDVPSATLSAPTTESSLPAAEPETDDISATTGQIVSQLDTHVANTAGNTSESSEARQTNVDMGNEDEMTFTKEEVLNLIKQGQKTSYRPDGRPPRFSGAMSDNAKSWLKQFDNYCDLRSIEDVEKVKTFCLFTEGMATLWFQNLKPEQTLGLTLKLPLMPLIRVKRNI